MSDTEEQFLDIEENEESASAPKKKVAKKKAAKKAAKKKTAKKTVAAAVEASDDPVPETFSASPDDMDDYGDISARETKVKPESEEFSVNPDSIPTTAKEEQEPRNERESVGDDRASNFQRNRPSGNFQHNRNKKKKKPQQKGHHGHGHGQNPHNQPGQGKKNKAKKARHRVVGFAAAKDDDLYPPSFESLVDWDVFKSEEALQGIIDNVCAESNEAISFNELYESSLDRLQAVAQERQVEIVGAPNKKKLLRGILDGARRSKSPIRIQGIIELHESGYGFIVYNCDNYRVRAESTFVNKALIERFGLQRGHKVDVLASAPKESETCPFALRIDAIMGKDPQAIAHVVPFTDLIPYYPLQRMLLETSVEDCKWDNLSMRIVDLLTPVGLGQRGLIVAPPRTGKTVLLQSIANAIRVNSPEVHLIILLIDERPEEVTDFRRQVAGAEVVSSTFDESAESHVHAAEMVIEKARRMVEDGQDVVILLDSITRLARAYNTLMPSSGKILSGGVEAGALQKPKRFFGSARNIEDGGSLTILGTALVETGSKMDEVIFEEFKGTGNMELDLDRELSNKRVYPALSFEKSGTRKEELLYHPDELQKIYSLRRAMKGVPSVEAMEMLITRVKKTKNNAEFLMSMSR